MKSRGRRQQQPPVGRPRARRCWGARMTRMIRGQGLRRRKREHRRGKGVGGGRDGMVWYCGGWVCLLASFCCFFKSTMP